MDKDRAIAHIERLVPAVASMIRSAPDPQVNAIGVWSLQELAAHLVSTAESDLKYVRGERPPVATVEEIDRYNAERLAAYVDEPLPELADRLEIHYKSVIEEFRNEDWSRRIPWYGGLDVAVGGLAGFALGELLVHGHDIARATSSVWTADREAASLVFEGIASVMPYYVDPEKARGFSATFDLNMRGGPRRHLIFQSGELTIEQPSSQRRIDCHISADPVSYLLLGYGRIGPILPALTGKIVAYGGKPWLAMKLPTLFRSP